MTEAHKRYEATVEFQAYWAAMLEAERLQGVWSLYRHNWPAGNDERTACYTKWRKSVHLAQDLLKVCRSIPEHLDAFGW